MRGSHRTARIDSVLFGILNADVREACLHIMRGEVAPDYRRRGIAQRLFDAARAFAIEAGAARLALRVRDNNALARALYLNYGFRETGRRQCRFACPVDRLPAETDVCAERGADEYKYPVRLFRNGHPVGGGQFNEEVSGIKDISLDRPKDDLFPALAALRPLLKPSSEILYVMTDNDQVIKSCEDQNLILQSTILDMECNISARG